MQDEEHFDAERFLVDDNEDVNPSQITATPRTVHKELFTFKALDNIEDLS